MGVLSSKLIVSLTDRTRAGTRNVLRNVAAIKAANTGLGSAMSQTTQMLRRQSRTMRAFRTLGGSGSGMAGLGATALAGGFLANELKYQEAMNRTQAIFNMADDRAIKPHRDLVVELAKRYPTTSAEIAKGATELAMAGMTMKEVNQVLEATVQGSMASGESIKTVGQGVTDVVMGLGQALTKGNFLKINNVLVAAGTSYAQNYRQFLDGLAKTAPLARMQGMAVERLAGILGILADAGFKGAKGGTALRTSMINAAAPTKKAAAMLRQYEIDISKFQKRVDSFQLTGKRGAASLTEYISDELNIDGKGSGLAKVLEPILSDPKALKNIGVLRQRLGKAIADTLGESGAENRKLIGSAVNRFVQAGFQQLDFEGLLRHLAEKGFDKNTGAMKELFGKRFIAQMASVIDSMRKGSFDKKMEEIFLPRIDGAVERFAKILMKGLPGALKRLGGAFDAFMRSMGSSGAMDTVSNLFGRMTTFVNEMSKTNPGALKALTLALLGIGVVAPVGFALQGIGAAISFIAGTAGVAATAVAFLSRGLLMAPFVAASGTWAAAAAGIGLLATRAKAARTAMAGLMLLSGVGGGKAVAWALAAAGVRKLWGALKLFLGLTVAGAAITALVAGFKFIQNNWNGIGAAIKGIGEGFMSNLGPAQPVAEGIASAIKGIFNWLDRISGPLDASEAQWKSWGMAVGEWIGYPIKKISKLLDWIGRMSSGLTDTALGRWIGRRIGFDGRDVPVSSGSVEDDALGSTAASTENRARQTSVSRVAAKPAGNLTKARADAATAVQSVRSAKVQIESIANSIDLTSSGRKIMTSLAAGMRATMNEPISAMRDTAQRIKNHVPQSPAREGPLRGIHRHGLMSELARGIRNDTSLVTAMNGAAQRARRALDGMTPRGGSMQPALAGSGASGSGAGNYLGAINVHVNVPPGVGSADDIGKIVGREVQSSVNETFSDGGV